MILTSKLLGVFIGIYLELTAVSLELVKINKNSIGTHMNIKISVVCYFL